MYVPEDSLELVTLIIFVLVILGFFYLMLNSLFRSKKGSLSVELAENKVFHRGELLKGIILLETKKNLQIRKLRLNFLGLAQVSNNSHLEESLPVELAWRKVDEVVLVIEENFIARKNENRTFNFEILIPHFNVTVLDKLRDFEFSWSLQATAEVDGVDLVSFSKDIEIFTGPSGDFHGA
jgi:hypothetical protein